MTKRLTISALALLLCIPAGLTAQEAVVGSLKGLHDITAGNITATAEMLDEDMYGFRPTEDVRTVGELLGHIANAQYLFCGAVAGGENPNAGNNWEEQSNDKAAIVQALADAFAYCEAAYANTSDAEGSEMATFFGNEMAKSAILAFNSAHNYEHYGNLVTYMRLNGITPPSSM